jgi:hypothetical protein
MFYILDVTTVMKKHWYVDKFVEEIDNQKGNVKIVTYGFYENSPCQVCNEIIEQFSKYYIVFGKNAIRYVVCNERCVTMKLFQDL